MQSKEYLTERVINWFALGMLILTVFTFSIAVFSKENQGEAPIGSFDSEVLNEDWTLEWNGTKEQVTLPASVENCKGEVLKISNILPDNVADGSSLFVKATMSDIYIYINGELREFYDTQHLSHDSYHIPSAYVVTQLSNEDSGATVEIHVRVKEQGKLNEVRIGNGNNAWFEIIKNNIAVGVIALMVLIVGVIFIVASSAMHYIANSSKKATYLGLLMIDLSIWVLGESEISQLFIHRPSLSAYYTYFSIELVCVFAGMFFDEAQHRRHHKSYVIVESLISAQLSVNLILHFLDIMELYSTLIFSHIWMVIAIILAIRNIVVDIRDKTIKQYRATSLGMVGFILMSSVELVGFYVAKSKIFGMFMSIGLIILAVATVIQIVLDQMSNFKKYSDRQTKTIVNTIEAIAGSIDAKDEYTGGHSERVGQYAAILARGMAADYDFSEEDILRIHYIGLMHDIGKIGVADSVLNKPGKLTENEFSLMKKHVDIGSEIMSGMDESIPGLVDGIRYHHERFDGKGYPQGLSETEIPLVARILCLVDCYDAMTSNRIYRKRLTDEEVRAEIVRCSGTQFDPALVEIFIHLLDSGEMRPYTMDGMATIEKGKLLKSSVLENYLHELNTSRKDKLNNPEHVRMLCFIMKLKEKKGEKLDVLFLGQSHNGDFEHTESSEEKMEMLNKFIKSRLNVQDMSIEYSDRMRIVAFFERTDEEIECFKNELVDSGMGVICNHI